MEEDTFEMNEGGSHTQDRGGWGWAEFQVTNQKGLRGNSLVILGGTKRKLVHDGESDNDKSRKEGSRTLRGPCWPDKEFGFHAKAMDYSP